ncbi:MAG: DegV family protein, partial [Chloroflexota bacterium]|nr:DegV family protein [Chloroflexota bacterium]
AAAEGKSLPEVIKVAEEVINKVSLVAIVDTIRYVYRTGRIPKIAARVGSMLNIRPLFTVSSGVPHFVGAVRNKERGIERLLNMMRDKVGTKKVRAAVMHAYALDEAEKLKKRVSSEFDCVEIWVCEFSPIMGYSAGTGTLGIAFYPEP